MDFWYRESYRPAYQQIADALAKHFGCRRVLDVGSGQGFLVDALVVRGVNVCGIERESEAVAFMSNAARERIVIGDATNGSCPRGDFDLVTCVEVAEHIEPEKTARFLDVLAEKTAEWLYFTADTTPSRLHINLHPHEWWAEEIERRGLYLDVEKSAVMRLETVNAVVPWISPNSFVFGRPY